MVFEPALALFGCSVGAIGNKDPSNSGRLKILKWPCNWAPAHPSHNLGTVLPVQGPYWRHFCVSGSLAVVLRVQGPSRRRSHLCIWWSGKALILYSPPLPVTDHVTDTPICAQRDPERANTWIQSPQSHSQQSWGSRVPEGNIPSYKPGYSERALCSAPAANCEEYCWHRNPAGDTPVCTPRNPYTGYQPLLASIHEQSYRHREPVRNKTISQKILKGPYIWPGPLWPWSGANPTYPVTWRETYYLCPQSQFCKP